MPSTTSQNFNSMQWSYRSSIWFRKLKKTERRNTILKINYIFCIEYFSWNGNGYEFSENSNDEIDTVKEKQKAKSNTRIKIIKDEEKVWLFKSIIAIFWFMSIVIETIKRLHVIEEKPASMNIIQNKNTSYYLYKLYYLANVLLKAPWKLLWQ